MRYLPVRAVALDGYEARRERTLVKGAVASGEHVLRFVCSPNALPGEPYRVSIDQPGEVSHVIDRATYSRFFQFQVYPLVAMFDAFNRVITVYALCELYAESVDPIANEIRRGSDATLRLSDAQITGTVDQRRTGDGQEIKWDTQAVFRCKGVVDLLT